jgi:type IX secretion system PorP/SprF family membrane protein
MKRGLVILFTLFCFNGFAQQKAMFTQYMFNGLAINPAYSAIDEALNVTAVARQQWTGFKGAPNTQSFTMHTPIKESNSSAGIMLMRDQIGEVITENGAYLTFAQRVQVGESTYLAAGVNGGISKYVANYSLLTNENTINDPVFVNGNNLRGNFGLGVMLFSDKFYAGISSPFFFYRDLGGASGTSTAYKSHYMMQGGYLANLGENVKFKPNVLVKYVNGAPLQMDVNANFLLKEAVWIGASWRSFDSFDAIAEIQLGPNIQLGYSYDFTTTDLAKVEGGSHEIMLNFRFPIKGRSFPRCYF